MSEWISQAELTKRWGKSRQTAAEWARRPGCPMRVRAGKPEYQWPRFLEWWATERERAAREEALPAGITEARTRKVVADAKRSEFELRQLEGDLVTVDQAVTMISEKLAPLRAELLTFPQRWAPVLIGCKTVSEMTAHLDRAIVATMRSLSGSAD